MPQTTRVAKPRVVRRRGRGKFYGGIRAEEIQNVRRGNVVGDQGLIGFVSKGGKQRSVALPPQAQKIISEYATSNVLRARSSGAYRRADPAISRRAELPEALCPHAHASRFCMIESSGPSKILRQTNPEGPSFRHSPALGGEPWVGVCVPQRGIRTRVSVTITFSLVVFRRFSVS